MYLQFYGIIQELNLKFGMSHGVKTSPILSLKEDVCCVRGGWQESCKLKRLQFRAATAVLAPVKEGDHKAEEKTKDVAGKAASKVHISKADPPSDRR